MHDTHTLSCVAVLSDIVVPDALMLGLGWGAVRVLIPGEIEKRIESKRNYIPVAKRKVMFESVFCPQFE